MSEVGSRKVFEDERVIVWHFDLEPGEHCAEHTHELDYVARVVSGAKLEVLGPDGAVLYAVDRAAGEPMSFQVVKDRVVSDDPNRLPFPSTHSVRNVGETTFREVLIEFKRGI